MHIFKHIQNWGKNSYIDPQSIHHSSSFNVDSPFAILLIYRSTNFRRGLADITSYFSFTEPLCHYTLHKVSDDFCRPSTVQSRVRFLYYLKDVFLQLICSSQDPHKIYTLHLLTSIELLQCSNFPCVFPCQGFVPPFIDGKLEQD